jgi:hypothetical protein
MRRQRAALGELTMCSRIQCKTCGKPSFSGCGRHVEQVLADVPVEQRCTCREKKRADDKARPSFWKRLLSS